MLKMCEIIERMYEIEIFLKHEFGPPSVIPYEASTEQKKWVKFRLFDNEDGEDSCAQWKLRTLNKKTAIMMKGYGLSVLRILVSRTLKSLKRI